MINTIKPWLVVWFLSFLFRLTFICFYDYFLAWDLLWEISDLQLTQLKSYSLSFSFFVLICWNWNIIALQCGVNFCCPTTLLSLPPTPRPHSTPLGHHRAVLPVRHSSFPLAGYFTHCSGYMSMLLSQFVMLYFFNKHGYVLFDSHNRICNLNLLNIITTNPYEHTSPLIIIKLLITWKVFVLLTLLFFWQQ